MTGDTYSNHHSGGSIFEIRGASAARVRTGSSRLARHTRHDKNRWLVFKLEVFGMPVEISKMIVGGRLCFLEFRIQGTIVLQTL
jgi:hypothetical protein